MAPARSRLYKPLLLGVAAVLMLGVSFSQRLLTQVRHDLGLTRNDDPLKNAPPVLAFTTVALGGFRGLIANALWVRATDLQEQDKYFEQVQLADWITKLQPHFTTVWVHQAWNMSYNISIKFTDPRDRWQWVLRGIELLRDEGLKYNPREPLMYRELAWHFQHKMGANLDDAHEYYKRIWGEEFSHAIGAARPNYDELLKPETDDARERMRLLREKFKMDPAWMREVDTRYGPLEWRLPEAHAIYWATFGLEKTEKEKLKKEDLIQLRRVIFQSMQLAFHRGRIIYAEKDGGSYVYGPNLDIVDRVNKAYEDMMAGEPDKADNIATGHRNFLLTAVYFLYTHNRISQADKWYQYVKKKYPETLLSSQEAALKQANPQAVIPEKTLDEYALSRVAEDIGETSPDRVKAILLGLLRESFLDHAIGDNERGDGTYLFAKKVYNRYMEEIGKDAKKRVGLPTFASLQEDVLGELLDPEKGLQPQFAAALRTLLNLPGNPTNAPAKAPAPNP